MSEPQINKKCIRNSDDQKIIRIFGKQLVYVDTHVRFHSQIKQSLVVDGVSAEICTTDNRGVKLLNTRQRFNEVGRF